MESDYPGSRSDLSYANGTESGRESMVEVATEIVKELEQTGKKNELGKSLLHSYWGVIVARAPRLKKSLECLAADTFEWANRGSRWRAFLILASGAVTFTGVLGVAFFFLFLTAAVLCAVVAAFLGSIAVVGTLAAIFLSIVTGTYMVALVGAGFVTGIAVFCTVVAALFVSGWVAFWWVIWMMFWKAFQVGHGVFDYTASRVSIVASNSARRSRESSSAGVQKKSE